MVDLDVLVITRTVFCDLIFVGLPGIPEPGQEFYSQGFALCPGGLGANTGMALSRLGMKAGVISKIGRLPLGDVLYRQLEAEGVDLTQVLLLDEEPTAVSVAMSLPEDRCFVTYPPRSHAEKPLPIDFEYVRLARHVLVSATDITRRQLERVREMGVGVTLDIGWDAAGEAQTVFDLLPLVDIFVPNEVEACRLTGTSDVRDALHALGRYVRHPIITLGARGSLTLEDGRVILVPTIDVQPVDTTGAGDVFAAGLLYGYLKGWSTEKCVRLGNICGALSTRGIGGGCSAPRWDDIAEVAPDLRGGMQAGCSG